MNKKSWTYTIFEAAKPCKGKLIFSVLFAIISVFSGLVPYVGVYQILCLFFEETPSISKVFFWIGICVLSYTLKIIFYGISTLLSHVSAYTILEQIRLKMIDKMMKAPLGEVLKRTSGELKNIIVDKVELIELPLAHAIPEGISNLLIPISVFIYLIFIDWRMALASLATLPVAVISFFCMMKTFNKQYADYMESSNRVNSIIVEYVGGIEVIKAFSQGQSSYEKFRDAVSSFKAFTLSWYKSTWKLMNFTMAVLPSTLLATIPVGMWLYAKGSLTPAEFGMCLILSLGIIGPVMWFTVLINDIKAIEYAVNESNTLLELPELPNTVEKVQLEHYDISLSNVSFSYEKGEDKALDGINLQMPQGEFCALVGPSGSGKSTIARLIARFWDVESGCITIGGVDIKKIPLAQLSSMVSFVTQDNFLFNCSLLENIRLGNPKASDEEVYRVARLAQCEAFIKNLSDGYHTTAGEAGKRLSGGERQRIAIARAMLKDAPIVILDEATAFTDPENEDKLQESISALTKGKTLVVIAHRLSTIKHAHQIIVLDKGKVVQSGTQDALLETCPLYKDMWETHIGAKKWVAGKERAYA